MNQLTYILNKIESYPNNQNIIKTFKRIWLDEDKNRTFPLCFSYLTDDVTFEQVVNLPIRILLVDVLKDDNSNLESILNDMLYLGIDIIEYLKADDDLYDIVSATLSPVTNSQLQNCAGFEINITFGLGNNCFVA